MKRIRSNNEILMNKDRNCNELMAFNTSEHAFYLCNVLQKKDKDWYMKKLVEIK